MAGSGVAKYNAQCLKQGSNRLNSISKTIHLAHLGILFIYDQGLRGVRPGEGGTARQGDPPPTH